MSTQESGRDGYILRDHDKIKKPDQYQYSVSRSSRSFEDSHSKRAETSGWTKNRQKDESLKQKSELGCEAEVSVKKGADSKTHFK